MVWQLNVSKAAVPARTPKPGGRPLIHLRIDGEDEAFLFLGFFVFAVVGGGERVGKEGDLVLFKGDPGADVEAFIFAFGLGEGEIDEEEVSVRAEGREEFDSPAIRAFEFNGGASGGGDVGGDESGGAFAGSQGTDNGLELRVGKDAGDRSYSLGSVLGWDWLLGCCLELRGGAFGGGIGFILGMDVSEIPVEANGFGSCLFHFDQADFEVELDGVS